MKQATAVPRELPCRSSYARAHLPCASACRGLSSCELSGELPPGWGSNGSLPRLEQLFLSYNKLSGTLPASWAGLTSLQDLCAPSKPHKSPP